MSLPASRSGFSEGSVRRAAALWLLLFGGILTAAAGMVVEDSKAHFGGVTGPSCWLKEVLDRPCPGCGLTRSVACTVQGDLTRAFSFHPGGPLILLACVVGMGVQSRALYRGARGDGHRFAAGLTRGLLVLALIPAVWRFWTG